MSTLEARRENVTEFDVEYLNGPNFDVNDNLVKFSEEHIFRASPMTLVQVYVAKDVARDAMYLIGTLGCMHFRDLNEGVSVFNRLFVAELRKLDEALRNIRQLESYISPHEILDTDTMAFTKLSTSEVQQMCHLIAEDTERLGSMVASYQKLTDRRDELIEERLILYKSQQFFGKRQIRAVAQAEIDRDSLLGDYEDSSSGFDIDLMDPLSEQNGPIVNPFRDSEYEGYSENPFKDPNSINLSQSEVLAGVIDSEKSVALERLCWRTARGNLYFTKYPIENQSKVIFMIFTHGRIIGERVKRLAESLDARIMLLTADGRNERLAVINDQLNDLLLVIDQTAETLRVEKRLIASRFGHWKSVIAKEHAVYETLNFFSSDNGRQGLIGEGWIPTDQLKKVEGSLMELSVTTSQVLVINVIKTTRTPPTFHTTNKVTAAFQAMVDVYGIARNGEVNPGLPTTVTFPFLFAVMFGDLGHGFILFLGASVLVFNEQKIARQRKRDELFDMAFTGRYVLLLMGLFSMFTGLIYNDLFSQAMTIFPSAWEWKKDNNSAQRKGHSVYPFGIDWAWHGAENNLRFTNSYKMKLSVLLGFSHMTYSLIFQFVNARHFRSWIDIWGNFVPGMLFMQSIFGYLSITIVYKWCVNWIESNRDPPGLLDMLIKMFLSPGSIDKPLYKGQAFIQCFLLFVALSCVPWLLLFKPLYLRRKMMGHAEMTPLRLDEYSFAIDEDVGTEFHIHDDFENDDYPESSHHAHESFGDIMIHQVIHTIEFCLNCISHTASYLRLWALSLAHNQLSQVLWNMTLKNAFGPRGAKGIIMVVVLFGMWFVITVLVLVCMEGTSAMLHALRLQWVEAMSKHFEGEGYAFEPFDLETVEN